MLDAFSVVPAGAVICRARDELSRALQMHNPFKGSRQGMYKSKFLLLGVKDVRLQHGVLPYRVYT